MSTYNFTYRFNKEYNWNKFLINKMREIQNLMVFKSNFNCKHRIDSINSILSSILLFLSFLFYISLKYKNFVENKQINWELRVPLINFLNFCDTF